MNARGVRLAGLAALVVALAIFPIVFTKPYPRDVMIKIFLYGLLAQAWNLLGGYCGQISLGNAVFFGIGAYTSSVLGMWWGVSPWLGMAAGMGLAVVVSQVIGFPCFRLRGHYFAIATIAIGEIVQTIMINWDALGGARGLWLPIKPETLVNFQFHRAKWPYYYIALGLFAGVFAVTVAVERSRIGYYFRAIREDPEAAQSLGVPLTRYKLLAIALSAGFTALGGSFYAQYVLFIDPESVFPLSLSILICLVAVLGGVGTRWGPFLGAIILIPLSEATRVYFGGTGKAVDLMIYGGLIVLVAVFQPGGLTGLLARLGGGGRPPATLAAQAPAGTG
ncbi:MAG TPA: branched-chain amino acid ABC transporter permease [Methylomirabilota bacterium]|jgi:branched-chain amino acid transport system permease protein|nr:branched-chain amino acid ABC transporter permease [Methylomirabilota bacterium]